MKNLQNCGITFVHALIFRAYMILIIQSVFLSLHSWGVGLANGTLRPPEGTSGPLAVPWNPLKRPRDLILVVF